MEHQPFAPQPRGSKMTGGSNLGSVQERSYILFRKSLLAVTVVLFAISSAALAQTLTPLKHQPPDGVILSFQLTDGTVMVQGNNYSDWWKLTPDDTGSYVNGKWSQLASLPAGYAPYAMSSASWPTAA